MSPHSTEPESLAAVDCWQDQQRPATAMDRNKGFGLHQHQNPYRQVANPRTNHTGKLAHLPLRLICSEVKNIDSNTRFTLIYIIC